MTYESDTLSVVRDQRSALIRDELRARGQREQLERAVRDAIRLYGRSIDEVSDASGMTPAEIRRVLDAPPIWDGDRVDVLAGTAL